MMHYMFSLLMLFLFVSAIMGCSHINISDPSPDQKYFMVQLLEVDSREIITGENALKSAEREGKLSFEIKKNKIEKQCYSISKKISAFYRFRPVTKSDILSHAYMVYEYPLIRLRSGKKSSINFDVSYPCMNMDTYLSRQSGKILSERSVQALVKEKNDDSAIIHIKYVFPTEDVRFLHKGLTTKVVLEPYEIDREFVLKYGHFYLLGGFETFSGLTVNADGSADEVDIQYKMFYIRLIPPRQFW